MWTLSKPMEAMDLEKPLPPLWPYFESIRHAPVLSIRGENSDLFSAATQAEMGRGIRIARRCRAGAGACAAPHGQADDQSHRRVFAPRSRCVKLKCRAQPVTAAAHGR